MRNVTITLDEKVATWARVFVDTNVLVHAADASETHKQERALAWMTWLWAGRSGRLSYQFFRNTT